MNVEDLLAGGLPIGEEEVDPLAAKGRAPKSGGSELCDPKELRAVFRIEVSQVGCVRSWHDQHVPRGEGLDVHERHRPLVLVNDADLGFARGEAAQQAVAHPARSSVSSGNHLVTHVCTH